MTIQKFIHDVSPDLTQNAQYVDFANIASTALTQGSTVRFFPGAYAAISSSMDNITFEGVGDKEEVTFAGITLSNASANTLTFKNMTITNLSVNANATVKMENCILKGGNSQVASGAVAVEFGTAGEVVDVTMIAKNCEFNNTVTGVRNHGAGVLTFKYCDLSDTDVGIVSNAACIVQYCELTVTGANAYFDSGSATIRDISLLGTATTSADGDNGAVTTRTIRAFVA